MREGAAARRGAGEGASAVPSKKGTSSVRLSVLIQRTSNLSDASDVTVSRVHENPSDLRMYMSDFDSHCAARSEGVEEDDDAAQLVTARWPLLALP